METFAEKRDEIVVRCDRNAFLNRLKAKIIVKTSGVCLWEYVDSI